MIFHLAQLSVTFKCPKVEMFKKVKCVFLELMSPVDVWPVIEVISSASCQVSHLSSYLPFVSPRALSRNFPKSSEFMLYVGAGILAVRALLSLRMC